MFKKGIIAIIVISLLISAVSCSKKETISQSTTAGNEQDMTQSQTTADQAKPEDSTNPVEETRPAEEAKTDGEDKTGFVFPQEGIRPYAVMIDNEGSKPLPQGGIYLAQVVYEAIVEGGVTRLMPVFWGVKPELIGPVRSSRHYFIDYSMEHDAIYVHFGYSPQALYDLKTFKINNINGVGNGGEVFWDLTKDKKNWQDSYTSMEKVIGYVNRVKYRVTTDKKPVFTYYRQSVELSGGQKAEKINIKYSNSYSCSYSYDPASKTYPRLRQGKPHMERITGKQLAAVNIIIQSVKNQRIKGDTEDRQELFNVGKGSGWYITSGKAIKIKWSKSSRTAPTRYTDESGNPIVLNPGQTWVQIVPVNAEIAME